jgi:hypothetical protein
MMDAVQEKKIPGAATGSPPVSPVAGQPPGIATGNVAVPLAPVQTVPLFGGNRGGKARRDGLVPGSPEAVAADKKRERERKRKVRERDAAVKLVEPPPLPSAAPGVPGAAPPPPGALAPGLPGEALPPGEQIILWDPELFKPLVREAVEATEAARVKRLQEVAEKAALPGKLVKLIADDAKYVPAFKSSLNITAPRTLAKLLNRTGVSGKWSDEALCTLSLIAIWMHGKRVESRLEKLIADKQAEDKKAAEAKQQKQ